MDDLVQIREQVYTDPRPAGYFDRFYRRARARDQQQAVADRVPRALASRMPSPAARTIPNR